jgi:predicted nucleic acid-binding protein
MAGRVLPFDADATVIYPIIAAARRRIGRPISQIDAQIAAMARSRGANLATRNVGDFLDCGLALIYPWAPR